MQIGKILNGITEELGVTGLEGTVQVRIGFHKHSAMYFGFHRSR